MITKTDDEREPWLQ